MRLRAALGLWLVGWLPAVAARLPETRVNTVWVVPELRHAWVEPLVAIRKPGGGLYTIEGFVAQRDLGDSLKDAIAFLKARPDRCPGFAENWRKHDHYLTWEDADQPRGGPSAGLAFAVAAYGALLELPARSDVAFTGAVNPDGSVRAIAGLPLKIAACRKAGMRVLCVPAADRLDPAALDLNVAEELRLVAVESADEAFFEAFGVAGPQKARYERMLALYEEHRQARAKRNRMAARLAIDALVDLVPNDLSAQRLQLLYTGVDMRETARNLYADAASAERDGQIDEALRLARRAWTYADESTRRRNWDLLERIERAALPPDQRDQLQRAQTLVDQGDIVGGYRLFLELRAKTRRNPYLDGIELQWKGFGEVTALAGAAEQRPDDVNLQVALANAYLAHRAPTGAARVFARLRAQEPDKLKWPLDEALAWDKAGRPEKVAAVLRSIKARWPTEAANTARLYRIELQPPELTVPGLSQEGCLATCIVKATDPSGPVRLTARFDEGPVLTAPEPTARLTLDLGRLIAGPHQLRVWAVDRFGNEAVQEATVQVPELDAGPVVRPRPAPKPGVAGGRVALTPGAPLVVPAGTRLTVDGPLWFGTAALQSVAAWGERSATAPFGLLWDTTDRLGTHEVTVSGTLADGAVAEADPVKVTVVAPPAAWLLSPAAGSRVGGSTPLIVAVAERPPTATVTLEVDGWPWVTVPGDEPARVNLDTLAAGEHLLRAWVDAGAARWVTPSIRVTVRGAAPEPLAGQRAAGLFVSPSTAAGLLARAAGPHPALTELPHDGVLGWSMPQATWEVGQPPHAGDTALRLDGCALTSLLVGQGDALAFGTLPAHAELGPQPTVTAGPLATQVWSPARAGSYRLTLGGKPLLVTVVDSAPVAVHGPPPGAILVAPTVLRLSAPAQVRRLTLLDGDRPLGSWPRPAPALLLDPRRLNAGYHLLRVVGTMDAGATCVSLPLALRTE
jgi:hypothetical protein